MKAECEGREYAAMANLGAQPTFHQEKPVLEVHLIGFNDDLYGKKLRVSFLHRLRDIVAFPDTNALVEQLNKDKAETLAVVSASQSGSDKV